MTHVLEKQAAISNFGNATKRLLSAAWRLHEAYEDYLRRSGDVVSLSDGKFEESFCKVMGHKDVQRFRSASTSFWKSISLVSYAGSLATVSDIVYNKLSELPLCDNAFVVSFFLNRFDHPELTRFPGALILTHNAKIGSHKC